MQRVPGSSPGRGEERDGSYTVTFGSHVQLCAVPGKHRNVMVVMHRIQDAENTSVLLKLGKALVDGLDSRINNLNLKIHFTFLLSQSHAHPLSRNQTDSASSLDKPWAALGNRAEYPLFCACYIEALVLEKYPG